MVDFWRRPVVISYETGLAGRRWIKNVLFMLAKKPWYVCVGGDASEVTSRKTYPEVVEMNWGFPVFLSEPWTIVMNCNLRFQIHTSSLRSNIRWWSNLKYCMKILRDVLVYHYSWRRSQISCITWDRMEEVSENRPSLSIILSKWKRKKFRNICRISVFR